MNWNALRTACGLVTFLVCASCGTITEEIWVNADGSGQYRMFYDADDMLDMLEMMGEMQEAQPNDGEADQDPQELVMEALSGSSVDTVIHLADVIPDSVREVFADRQALRDRLEAVRHGVTEATLDSMQASLPLLERLGILFQVDKEARQLGFGMLIDFDDPSGVAATMGAMSSLQALSPKAGGSPLGGVGGGGLGQNGAYYTLQGNELRVRVAMPGDIDELTELVGEASDEDVDGAAVEELLESMGMGPHDLIIHVPGKIRGVTGASSRLVNDNTVVLTVDYLDMLRGGPPLDASVRFKPKRKFRRVVP